MTRWLHTFVHTVLLLGVAYGLLPKRLRSTFSLKKVPQPPILLNEEDKSQPCHTCVYYMPHFESGQTMPSLGKCVLFGDMENHEYATHCRSNIFQCGGFCYHPKTQSYLE